MKSPSSQRIEFPGSQGVALAARLDLPDNAPRRFAVFAHCFTCSKESKAAAYISRALAEQGFGVLRFDFTGLGGSGGDFGNTNFTSNIDDLLAAADWLGREHGAPALLIGHSLGGAAVLAAASGIAACEAVVTLGAPFDPGHVRDQFAGSLEVIERDGESEVKLAGRPFRITRQFVDDLGSQPQQQRIHDLGRALLVLHSPIDRIVGIDNARRIFEAALHPKSFVSLDDADHLLTREADARYAAQVIGAWASRYVGELPTAAHDAAAPPPEGFVRVRERGTGLFANTVTARSHHLLADEPEAVGGTDLGMTPYELLQAGLGTCTAMTIRMVAQRRKWPLERVTVDLHHEKIHATDCDSCETAEGRIDRIDRVIHLEGDLSSEQREALLAIADKCPVHKTLHAEVQIRSTLAD
ncbi:MAG: bifunctional alpha/beta hydrolase/OsmC family protein [Burkholderiaceae bacterium]